jgi:hypothetical protein
MKSTRLGVVAARMCALALISSVFTPSTASAQISNMGVSIEVIQAFMRGVDGGYDPKNNSYLMVGGASNIYGVCVAADGKPKAAPFLIYQNVGAGYGAYPRARYSPDIDNGNGGFLVVWVVEANNSGWGPVHSRVVSCASGPLGPVQMIDPALAFLESAPAVAYSPVSKRFLVVSKGAFLNGKIVDNAGTGVGAALQLTTAVLQARDPGVTWNSTTDDFGVGFSGESYAAFVKVPAANPAAFVRNTVRTTSAGAIFITDIDYNAATNTYAMAFWDLGITRVAEIDANGNLIALRIGSGQFQAYDALSIAANPLSGTYLLTGVRDIDNKNIDFALATELDGHGTTKQAEMQVSNGTPPARYARAVSSTTSKTWNVSWSGRNFAALANQIVATGGASVAPTSAPRLNIDRPANNSVVLGTQIDIGGWAFDAGATTGTGIDAIHVWAWPVGGGAPIWVGAAAQGAARPDVASAFGQTRYSTSGFNLVGSITTPGTYDIAVYGRSTVAQTFNVVQSVRVNVRASRPAMSIDTPTNFRTVGPGAFAVSGWALDLGSASNSGVDAVHIWAFPTTGAAPQFFGAAAVGAPRPDVAAAFGGAQFTNSGFNAVGTLPAGVYDLVVFARSSLADTFNNVQVVRVTVQ